MPKVKVLVVDDSAVIRQVVTGELSADPDIEVVGTAPNGRIALSKLTQINPDLVILDVEMPELDGLATLAELRRTWPRLPVIMFSALTERGAAATLEALALGATDYFPKPTGHIDESRQVIRERLIPAIRLLGAKPAPRPPAPLAAAHLAAAPGPIREGRIEVVAIGVSTGGPNALAEVFRLLPADFPVPLLIVQHMPPMFTRLLAERLSANSPMKVSEAKADEPLTPGRAWIAPGDYHLTVRRVGRSVRTVLDQAPQECSCRPAADPLFRSVAQAYEGRCLAVVMTGMGQDGLRGSEAIVAAGGSVLAQDEASSVVWGMPGAVVRAGLAEKVLPLSMISREIVRRVRASRSP